MADSIKLTVTSIVLCLLAWLSSGLVGEGRTSLAETLAFLLYFLWPALSLVLALLTAVFAARDVRRGESWQATAALLLSLVVAGFSWTQFHGWE